MYAISKIQFIKCETRSFTRSIDLIKDIEIHAGEKQFKWDGCLSKLTEVKPYKSNVCLAKFPQDKGLRRHIQTYCREKPYKCDVCFAKST